MAFTTGHPVFIGYVSMLFYPSIAWRPHMSLYSGFQPKICCALLNSQACPTSGAFDESHKTRSTAKIMKPLVIRGPGSSVGIATGYDWTVSGSNPSGGEIFRTCPDRPWGPHNLTYSGYWVIPRG